MKLVLAVAQHPISSTLSAIRPSTLHHQFLMETYQYISLVKSSVLWLSRIFFLFCISLAGLYFLPLSQSPRLPGPLPWSIVSTHNSQEECLSCENKCSVTNRFRVWCGSCARITRFDAQSKCRDSKAASMQEAMNTCYQRIWPPICSAISFPNLYCWASGMESCHILINEAFRTVEYNDPDSLAELKSKWRLHLPIMPPRSVVADFMAA